jgi:hypothetical protein
MKKEATSSFFWRKEPKTLYTLGRRERPPNVFASLFKKKRFLAAKATATMRKSVQHGR